MGDGHLLKILWYTQSGCTIFLTGKFLLIIPDMEL